MYTMTETAVIILLLLPVIAAAMLALFNPDIIRNIITGLTTIVIIASSIFLTASVWNKGLEFTLAGSAQIGTILFIVEIAIAVIVLGLALKYRRPLPIILALIQTGLVLYLEFSGLVHEFAGSNIVINNFSLIMVLIIGIIGTLICVYALGYMKDYHNLHPEILVRKRYFFAVMFLFLSAMFGIVISNNIMWLLAFWEVTTLCSFLLIGYSRTPEAVHNSFRAVWMNLIGGIAFACAIIYLLMIPTDSNMLAITDILAFPDVSALTIPLALIALAGLTKAAQIPFATWLTGAMVAPTPVSALLHSSTMVKAGVFILVLFAPLFAQTWVGIALSFVGIFTFVAAAVLAISQSNAKRVLAYSTISNLGLITACAGIGSPEAVSAAILLIIFHAIAKALLFICVGAAEHKIGSRDIEDMDSLLARQPLLATFIVVGICGMYLAPFGMLISKWAALEAFLSAPLGYVFVVFLSFGSAFTIFFWTKWLGKLFMRLGKSYNEEVKVHFSEKLPIVTFGTLVIAACAAFPLIITYGINPYLEKVYSYTAGTAVMSADTLFICGIMLLILGVLVAAAFFGSKSGKTLPPYLNGRAVDSEGRFLGSLGVYKEPTAANYYLEEYCSEKVLLHPAEIISIIIIAVMFAAAFMGLMI